MLQGLVMGISRTEVNLRRLLAAAPQQQNQAKLIHVCFFACPEISQIKDSFSNDLCTFFSFSVKSAI